MKKGLCGVVILYHPSRENLSNILSYAGSLDKLWILDNSEHSLQDVYAFFPGMPHVEVVQDGVNRGIGARINFAIQKATEEGFAWLLTMDQDSFFSKPHFSAYARAVSEFESESVALIGVKHGRLEKTEAAIGFEEVDEVITSGTWINMSSIAFIGMMNEDLFIDEVDTEFSYRALVNGWKVMHINGISMVHELGTEILVHPLLARKRRKGGLHSPTRLYYITRNFFWVRKKYSRYLPEIFKRRTRQLFHIYKNNLLYNSRKGEMIRMILKGYNHFRKEKLGKLQ